VRKGAALKAAKEQAKAALLRAVTGASCAMAALVFAYWWCYDRSEVGLKDE